MRLSLITVFFVSLLVCLSFPGNLPAQNWEYALSHEEFLGSTINDLEVVGDKIILAGGLSSCAVPTLWVFDTSSHLINYLTLETPGYYYDSENKVILLLAYVQIADDVGGSSTYAWKLDLDLTIISAKDLFGSDVIDYNLSRTEGRFITAVNADSVYIFNSDNFNLVNRLKIVDVLWSDRDAILIDSMVLAYEYVNDSLSFAKTIDWQGEIRQQKYIAPAKKMLPIDQHIFSLGRDNVFRKYSFPDMILLDSIDFSADQEIDINQLSANSIEVISYDLHQPSVISHYDANLDLIRQIRLELNDERNVKGKIKGNTYYHRGQYFSYHPSPESGIPFSGAIMSYVRKMNLNNPEIIRPSLKIKHVSLKNEIVPLDTFETMTGRTWYFYDSADPLIYEITFENTGANVVNDFCYYTDIWYGSNCKLYNGHKYIEDLQLDSGDVITILDTLYRDQVYLDRGLIFYVAAPNHQLSDSSVTGFQVRDFTTRAKEFTPPKPLSIYPNPSQDLLHLANNELISHYETIEIISAAGQVAKKPLLTGNNMDISDLPFGLYYVRMIGARDIWQGSFIKQ